eukprot:GHVL01006467.1.p1 GENE.GHVL01006467.1~~GHVL01006467.1.p1  ORF type:complete len:318 (+),score=96.79 GHVL01006467.1:163-1116(+)
MTQQQLPNDNSAEMTPAEIVSFEIIDDIIYRGALMIQNMRIQNNIPPYVARCCIKLLLAEIRLSSWEMDINKNDFWSDNSDPEPIIPIIDTWASCCIPYEDITPQFVKEKPRKNETLNKLTFGSVSRAKMMSDYLPKVSKLIEDTENDPEEETIRAAYQMKIKKQLQESNILKNEVLPEDTPKRGITEDTAKTSQTRITGGLNVLGSRTRIRGGNIADNNNSTKQISKSKIQNNDTSSRRGITLKKEDTKNVKNKDETCSNKNKMDTIKKNNKNEEFENEKSNPSSVRRLSSSEKKTDRPRSQKPSEIRPFMYVRVK